MLHVCRFHVPDRARRIMYLDGGPNPKVQKRPATSQEYGSNRAGSQAGSVPRPAKEPQSERDDFRETSPTIRDDPRRVGTCSKIVPASTATPSLGASRWHLFPAGGGRRSTRNQPAEFCILRARGRCPMCPPASNHGPDRYKDVSVHRNTATETQTLK